MKQYFNVSFQYSEDVYCANIAHAESPADAEAYYSSKYPWVSVSPAADYEVEEARRRGKPIVEVNPQRPEKTEERREDTTAVFEKITAELEARKDRSAWDKGVTLYAFELVEELRERAEHEGRNPEAGKECREWMLNGADDWSMYSWGGSSLIYNGDIAERLCNPSELKKTRDGERRPSSREEWLDVQARALFQACNRVARLYRSIVTE